MLSDLNLKLIKRMSNAIFRSRQNDFITKEDIEEAQKQIEEATEKYEICSALENMHYCFSVILSEVRADKRKVISDIFEQDKKIAEEKKALQTKLDSYPEYARFHAIEEMTFNFLEYIENTKNQINWLIQDEE